MALVVCLTADSLVTVEVYQTKQMMNSLKCVMMHMLSMSDDVLS